MKVKAKFKCNSVTNFEHAKEVRFSAVYGTSGENADFAKATPCGDLSMRIDNDTPASNAFVPGKSYYLNIEEAND